jgi:inorganic pyrophosphatase
VCNGDPSFDEIHHHTDLPSHTLRQIKRFFQDYKVLENKEVVIDDIMDKDEAIKVMSESLSLYRQLRRGEVKSRH